MGQAVKEALEESGRLPGERVQLILPCAYIRNMGVGMAPFRCEMQFIAVAMNGKLLQSGVYGGTYCAEKDATRLN